MNEAVDRVIEQRERLDRGFPASVVLSAAFHLLVGGVAFGAAWLGPRPPLVRVAPGILIPLPPGGGGPLAPEPPPTAAKAPPAAPEPAPEPPPKVIQPPREAKPQGLPRPDARKAKPKPQKSAPPARPAPPSEERRPPASGTTASQATPGLGLIGPSGPGVPYGTDPMGDWYLAGVQRKIWLIWVRQVEAVRFGPRMQPHHGVAWQCLPESADVYPRCLAPREGSAKPQAVQGGESRRITAPEARDAGASNGAMLIPLTEGNIRHGHIYLTRHIGRFPPDALGGATQAEAGRPLRLHMEGDQVVETDIVKSRRIFRSRAWRAWFARQRARAGDRVRLEPKGPRDFRVTLVRGSARD